MSGREERPVPVLSQSGNCMGVLFFRSEVEANAMAALVKVRGDRYNGGLYDGMPCGREANRDFTHPELGKLYAVTVA